MNLTVSSLVRAAAARSLPLSPTTSTTPTTNEDSAAFVDCLLDVLGNNSVSTPRNLRLESTVALRKIVRLMITHSHPTLRRLVPMLTALQHLRESVAHCSRVNNDITTSKPTVVVDAAGTDSTMPLPLHVTQSPLAGLHAHHATFETIAAAWMQISSHVQAVRLQVRILEESDTAGRLELSIAEDCGAEANIVQEELEHASSVLELIRNILEHRHCTDPDALRVAIRHAGARFNNVELLVVVSFYPLWEETLELGHHRLYEAEQILGRLRMRVDGVLDLTTIHHTLDEAARNKLGGKYVEKLRRVQNELELARHATGDLLDVWVQRRNIGLGRELTTATTTSPAGARSIRPVDVLTSRLALSARMRDFVGLSNHESTLYVCDAMLMSSPGANLHGSGLEATMEHTMERTMRDDLF